MRSFLRGFIGVFFVSAVVAALYPKQADSQSFSLVGGWRVEFTLSEDVPHHLRFDADPPDKGRFLLLDPISSLVGPAVPTKAVWKQAAPDRVKFTGEITFPLGNCCRETGALTFSGSFSGFDSLSGEVVFSMPDPSSPGGFRTRTGSFTANREDLPKVRLLAPAPGQRLRRGNTVNIEWEAQGPAPLTRQDLFLSVDGGLTFFTPVTVSLGGSVRSFPWTIPEDMNKTKKALLLIEVTDANGNIAKALSDGTFRIK